MEESHAPATGGLLEAPVYTRPATWEGRDAPEVLLSGHHARVAAWRREQSLRRTAQRRPDLLEALDPSGLDARDAAVLAELGWDVGAGGGPPPLTPRRPAARRALWQTGRPCRDRRRPCHRGRAAAGGGTGTTTEADRRPCALAAPAASWRA